MNAIDIISSEIPELSFSDNGVNALNLMEEYKVVHLPIVHDGTFVGLISENEILEMEKPTVAFSAVNQKLLEISTQEGAHIYEILRLMDEFQLSVLPVDGPEGQYEGCITVNNLIHNRAQMQAVGEPGGTVVLEMNTYDYSLSQIAQIVEGNDAKILSVTVSTAPDSQLMEVTLKVNKEDLNPIIQTFNRYDYNIKYYYQKPRYSQDLKRRYEELMKYLNM